MINNNDNRHCNVNQEISSKHQLSKQPSAPSLDQINQVRLCHVTLMTSCDSMMTSRDNLILSCNSVMTSRDIVMTSRDSVMTSRDSVMTSRDTYFPSSRTRCREVIVGTQQPRTWAGQSLLQVFWSHVVLSHVTPKWRREKLCPSIWERI